MKQEVLRKENISFHCCNLEGELETNSAHQSKKTEIGRENQIERINIITNLRKYSQKVAFKE